MEEYIKDLEELRQELERRREELQKEIEKIDGYIKAIENLITEKSFTTADMVKEVRRHTVEETPEVKESIKQKIFEEKPIRRDIIFIHKGKPIAWVELYRSKSIVYIDRDLGLPIDDSLITRFLEPRFRDEMTKDIQEIEEGKRDSDKRFTYVIHDENGIITKIEMLDFGEDKRRRDNISKIRWVLKKYIEKKGVNQ